MQAKPNGLTRRLAALLTRRHVAGPAWWSVVSRLPVYLMSLAMVLVVREQGGSYAQAGLVSGLYTVGMALGSPLIARWADRRGRRTVLPLTGVLYPTALAALVWTTGPGDWAQPLLAMLAGVVLPPANACMRSLWARLPLRDDERDTAYLWEALLTEVLVIGAPLMLAALMLTGSAGRALTVVAVIGGAGAIGLALVRVPEDTDGAAGAKAAGDADGETGRSSLLGPLRSQPMLALAGVMVLGAVPIGLMTLAIPAFVDAHGSRDSTGLVYACWGVGSAVGALWLGRSQSEVAVHLRFPRLILAFALGTALPLLATSPLTLALALAVGSVPIALTAACEMTLVSTVADSRSLTEAFTWASVATVVGDALGQQAGGLLMEPAGPRGVFAAAFGMALVAALVAFACRGLLGRDAAVPAPAAAQDR
uniref:Putative efflux protein n=1 Tax=Streptomyces arginensis TaxID=1295550 RepID=M1SML9_STREL|nr:putative efflux protein [Streptomyces arginensis]